MYQYLYLWHFIVLVDGKRSLFGDSGMHGMEGIKFYTKLKTVTSRWPSGVRSNAEFVMPTMK